MPLLKRLFWIYFMLLIFEGALRKWILPQLSGPLLLIRDPVALLIIWEAYRTRKWPRRWSTIIGILSVTMICLCILQMIAGDNPWMIGLYGLRSYLLPFPVAFIMGEALDEADLRQFGQWTVWLLMPMVVLEAAQYLSPPSAFINKGAGDFAGQLGYAGGHVRASGTFSFVTGTMLFEPLAAAFLFYGIVDNSFAKRWLLFLATGALILSIPVTGSRFMVVALIAVLAFVAVSAFSGISRLVSALKVMVLLLVPAALVSQLPVFSTAMTTFQERIENAGGPQGDVEGNITGFETRFLSEFQNVINPSSTDQWYGNGMGTGSNMAAVLLTGSQQFLAGEGEVSRIVYEFGPVFGIAFLLFRLVIFIMVAVTALFSMRQRPLAWFLVPMLVPTLVMGTIEQPTMQGFMVMTLAFALAALKPSTVPAQPELSVAAPFHTRALSNRMRI